MQRSQTYAICISQIRSLVRIISLNSVQAYKFTLGIPLLFVTVYAIGGLPNVLVKKDKKVSKAVLVKLKGYRLYRFRLFIMNSFPNSRIQTLHRQI